MQGKTPFDVLIVGAGISGIGMAAHLVEKCPDKRFAILERRERIGGTWDLFRYPGIRSDSDMYTLGYAFKPWKEAKAIADGPSIRRQPRTGGVAASSGLTRPRTSCQEMTARLVWGSGSDKEACPAQGKNYASLIQTRRPRKGRQLVVRNCERSVDMLF